MVDATQTANTNDDLEDLTGRVSELERRLAIHNHADPYSQPIWVGNSSQGTANIVKPPSTGVMGENCSNGDALGFGTGNLIISQPTTDWQVAIGSNNYAGYCREKILSTVSGTLTSFSFYAYAGSVGNYTIAVDFYKDDAGSLGDNLYHTSSSYSLPSSGSATITVSPNIAIIGNTNYWVKISGAINGSGSTFIYYSSSSVYNNSFYAVLGSSVTANGGDLKFSATITKDTSKLYRISSKTTAEESAYVGISNKSCVVGETADITTWGFKNDYSTLIPGSPYYLTDSYGVIGTSPGTYTKQVGIGFSPTTLLIGAH